MSMVIYGNDRLFHDARSKAVLGELLDIVRRQPSDMLAFSDVHAGINIRGQRSLGLQLVPIANIIGSEGRYQDFDRRFLPRTDIIERRWIAIKEAMVRGDNLPPVELYKISDVYFVRDGNHRVSVARQLDRVDIDARVTELIVDVALSPNLSMQNLLLAHEYSDFLEWTNLHTLRPDERIEFSELGGYLDLVRQINQHRATLAAEQGRVISGDEAVASWYDTVYTPIVRRIREQRLVQANSGRTEADLYLWLTDPHCRACDGAPSLDTLCPPRRASWAARAITALRSAIGRLRAGPDLLSN